jgi:hypothetical protein
VVAKRVRNPITPPRSSCDTSFSTAFMESYFESQREHIFKGVQVLGLRRSATHISKLPINLTRHRQVLIYVFDVDSKNAARDLQSVAPPPWPHLPSRNLADTTRAAQMPSRNFPRAPRCHFSPHVSRSKVSSAPC